MNFLAPVFFACILPASAELRLEVGEKSAKVLDGETLVTEFRTDWKVPYLYPLVSPSGANITRNWPTKPGVEGEEQDHPHHRSVWMGHGLVNGADFWSFKDTKDAKINHLSFTGKTVDSFTASLEWVADGKRLLTEQRTHTFSKSDANTLAIDFTCAMEAVEDVTFGDTKEGMFAFRMDRTLRLKGPTAKSHIVNSEGLADNETWGKRAKWIAYHGPDELGKPAVAALFDHPSNFRFPTYWHVRDYGLVSANPFGVHDFEKKPAQSTLGNHSLKKGEKLVFKYAIVIHQGDLKSANLDAHWQTFSKN